MPTVAGTLELPPQQAITWDFETGNLEGWNATGTAFRYQPTQGDNARARVGVPSGHQGDFWIGTFERHPRGSQDPLGTAQGDEPQGILTSGTFRIQPGGLSFLVGGGRGFETRVELLVSDPSARQQERVRYATGEDSETMRRVQWDLTEFAGQAGVIRIVDQSSAAWGHINVDDFVFGPLRPTVPDLRGRTLREAAEMLAEVDLRLARGDDVLSEEPRGTVLEQVPEPGSLLSPGDSVRVDVAVWARVPDVTGMDTIRASQILVRARLRLGERQSRLSSEPPGVIVDQAPPAGAEQPPGSAVGVVIAAPVPTPDLVGRDSASARIVLAQQQLRLGSSRVRDADADPGTVVDQDPPAGMRVPLGTVVNVAVASGARVPDLVGMDSVAAVEALGRSRLTLGRVLHERSSAAVGSLIRQDVSPGSVVRPGTPVAVVVADGVSVPDVRGMRIGPVRDSLEGHQLSLGSITETPSEAPTGTVIEQAPGPGTVVPLRREVTVVLALGVPVAGVVGRSTSEARQILADLDLQVGDITQEESTEPPGTVLRQAPDSGTSVPLRTPVDLVVAQGVPVPDLAGADSLGARVALEGARLSMGHLELRPSTEPVGSVVGQSPAPGDVVALATPVDVVVAQGVIVPDIRQRPSASADSLVSSLGLGLVERGRKWSLSPAGAVLEQDPAPGVEVPLQTAVAVVVARHIPVGWIAAGLLLLVGALLAVPRVRRNGERKKKRPARSEARIELRPYRDAGSRAFRGGKPPRVALELRWRAVGELGHPAAGTPETLIRGERTRPPRSSKEGEHE